MDQMSQVEIHMRQFTTIKQLVRDIENHGDSIIEIPIIFFINNDNKEILLDRDQFDKVQSALCDSILDSLRACLKEDDNVIDNNSLEVPEKPEDTEKTTKKPKKNKKICTVPGCTKKKHHPGKKVYARCKKHHLEAAKKYNFTFNKKHGKTNESPPAADNEVDQEADSNGEVKLNDYSKIVNPVTQVSPLTPEQAQEAIDKAKDNASNLGVAV